ncbi:MAG: hypothetical protein Q9184_003346 [Pyrenodesmia sp. 2 TL-2023]
MSTALGLMASLASAAPAAPQPEARQVFTTIAFIGAADGIFYLTEPVDGSSFPIWVNGLSLGKLEKASEGDGEDGDIVHHGESGFEYFLLSIMSVLAAPNRVQWCMRSLSLARKGRKEGADDLPED